ncbi:hypothetical protein ACFTXM_08530 [Streptomyces sp. NPDC056930]|uniref:hypothetical protein n=1 Tax=Streptomyces sp. NPDC056930 TaxID=3345967 RepID=UPI0036352632
MIPAPHRMKGAALVLGASRAGETGPFGPYDGDTEHDADEQDQVLARRPAATSTALGARRVAQPG